MVAFAEHATLIFCLCGKREGAVCVVSNQRGYGHGQDASGTRNVDNVALDGISSNRGESHGKARLYRGALKRFMKSTEYEISGWPSVKIKSLNDFDSFGTMC